jgi:DedD protein
MAFFKFRKGGEDHAASAAPAESVEVLRKRARHRLIGTIVLVLVAVIGFPLLVDKQPRPVEFNIPIVIPDKNKVKPLPPPVATAIATPAPVAAPAAVASSPAKPVAPPATSPVATATRTPEPAQPVLSSPLPVGGTVAPASEERFVVQVGAYAEQTRAREARLKLERAGLKTYTQVIESKEGRRIRVRTGPYASRALAERDAEKIKKLDLPASVLTL